MSEWLITAVEDPETRIWHLSNGQCLNVDGLPCPCQFALCGHHIDHVDMFTYPKQLLAAPNKIDKTLAQLAPSVFRCPACFVKIAKEKRDE